MSDADLDRVRRDLETMKEAVGTELPFGPKEVRRTFLHSLLAVPLALWATVGPGTYMSLVIIVTLVVIAIAESSLGRKFRRQRFEHPFRWREYRYQLLGELAAVPFILGFFCWAVANGTPPRTMMGLVLLVGGGIFLFIAAFSPKRRFYGGMGLAMIACGSVMPWCLDRGDGLTLALLFFVGGSLSAAIQAWQLRRVERSHDAD